MPVAVRYRHHALLYADGNIFAALELALERPAATTRASPPASAIRLEVSWHGPLASSRPTRLSLGPGGVYAAHRLYPLGREPWCYLATNLPAAPAAVVEETERQCR